MASRRLLALGIFCSVAAVASPPYIDYSRCQYPTESILDGCPPGTIVVGPDSDFPTIQEAVVSIGNDTEPHHILVLEGTYEEQVNITRSGPLYILGQSRYAYDQSQNLVTVQCAVANGETSGLTDNAFTSCLTVAPSLNASFTGSGPTGFPVPEDTPFGSTDFRVYSVNFRNVATEEAVGPSHAVGVSRANAGFYFSGFYSYQDTVYVGKLGNAYFYGSELAGEVDFLYGFGTAWIQSSTVTLRGCGGGVIAWKGTNTTFENKYGCYISDSTIKPENETIAEDFVGKCSLGRPWNSMHRSVIMNTYMPSAVLPQGYTAWGDDPDQNNFNELTFMAEYGSHGPGWDPGAREAGNITKVLSHREVRPYNSPADVFISPSGEEERYVGWIDPKYLR